MPDTLGRHALIIEDEMVSSLGMQAILADLGFATFAYASTQAQALEQAQLRRPDLITADVNLMDGDGPGAIGAIGAVLGPIPAIYVTGDPESVESVEGAVIVAKPYAASDIASAWSRLEAQGTDTEAIGAGPAPPSAPPPAPA